jgi:hypothetical protein
MPPVLMLVVQQWLSPDETTGVKNGIRGAMRSLRKISGNPIRAHLESSLFNCEVNADCDPRAHDRRRRAQRFAALVEACSSRLQWTTITRCIFDRDDSFMKHVP